MQIETKKMKLDELKEDDKNARIHGKRNLDAIKRSLQKFTQYRSLVVQKSTNKIIAGNGTYQAAKALGWTELDCHVIDVDDNTATAIAIADNKTSDLSEWDNETLTELLQDLDGDLIEYTGFVEDELTELFKKFSDNNNDDDDDDKPNDDNKKPDDDGDKDKNSQIVISICKYPLILTDKNKVVQLQELFDNLKKQEQQVKAEINDDIFDAISNSLREKLNDE